MGFWNFYFITKFYWFERGYIHFDFILNSVFLILLLLPLPETVKNNRRFSLVKGICGIVIALLLLWHDSWLPSVSKSYSFIFEEGLPSKDYVFQFLLGFFNPIEWSILVFLFILCFVAVRNKIRLTPVIFIFLFIVPIQEYYQPKGEINIAVQKFFQSEAKRKVYFDKKFKDKSDFDIIILHVCSFSWDDLKGIGLENGDDPFLKQFNYLFTHFNTVTPYSAPSAIRLLRASCGQQTDKALYQNTGSDCYLVDALRNLGFEPFFSLNHDGVYGHFADDAQKFAHLGPPVPLGHLPVQAYSFDETPIYDDYAALENGWKIREESRVPKSFFYYNTISLHDGAHKNGDQEWWKKTRTERYQIFARKLFDDLTKFIHLVESSKRNTVVLFVPEHGMALQGTSFQPAGLREIPLPQITTVPVGIKLVGSEPNQSQIPQQIISKPASYLSLAYILSHFLAENPFESNFIGSGDWIDNIPQTDFVSENDQMQMIKIGQDYYLSSKGKEWTKVLINMSGFEKPESPNGKN